MVRWAQNQLSLASSHKTGATKNHVDKRFLSVPLQNRDAAAYCRLARVGRRGVVSAAGLERRFALMVRLAVSELRTLRWSIEEDIAQYLAAGITAIGVWRQKLADVGERKGAEILAESGIAVSSLQW